MTRRLGAHPPPCDDLSRSPIPARSGHFNRTDVACQTYGSGQPPRGGALRAGSAGHRHHSRTVSRPTILPRSVPLSLGEVRSCGANLRSITQCPPGCHDAIDTDNTVRRVAQRFSREMATFDRLFADFSGAFSRCETTAGLPADFGYTFPGEWSQGVARNRRNSRGKQTPRQLPKPQIAHRDTENIGRPSSMAEQLFCNL